MEAARLVETCLDAGVNLFDTADVYSHEKSSAGSIGTRCIDVLIATGD